MRNWTRRVVLVLAALSLTSALGVGTSFAASGSPVQPDGMVYCC